MTGRSKAAQLEGFQMKVLIFFALAALSGLTLLAYKDHAAYARLAPVLIVIFLLIYIETIAWDASVTYTFWELVPFISSEKFREARAAQRSLLIWNSWVPLAVMGSNAYLAFLLWGMPWLLRDGRT